MKPTRLRILQEGFVSGLIGYAVVVVVMGIADLLTGHSFFFTAALLGRGVFGGTGEVMVTPDAVFSYNGLHLLAFLCIGFFVAFVVFEVEHHPVMWYAAFLVILGIFFFSFVVVAAVANSTRATLPWWSILASNLAAALAMGAYLHRAHPRVWREVRRHADPESE